jgi:hypothetical protein
MDVLPREGLQRHELAKQSHTAESPTAADLRKAGGTPK